MQEKRAEIPFITEDPLSFEYDPDTGLLSVIFVSSFGLMGSSEVYKQNFRLELPLEVSRKLLADLPALQRLLERASEGPTKPDYVQ